MARFPFACLILTGLPGAGKSTSGALLAERLRFEFVDIDSLIEANEKMSVQEIFGSLGEGHFRRLETRTLEDLCRRREEAPDPKGLVLAVGGGLPESAHNRRLLNELGVVVYLSASIDAILRRIGSDRSRPLLQTDKHDNADQRRQRLESLLDRRETAYQEAHIMIDTSDLSTEEVVLSILEALKRRSNEMKERC